MNPIQWLSDKMIKWLVEEDAVTGTPPCDFDRLSFEIRPCDVILVEGRARVSEVIKTITQSPWTHSALYIGRLVDIDDPNVREHISWLYDGNPEDQLIIEPLLGEGTIICPLHKYKNEHLRICRPQGLSRQDVQGVIHNASKHLGQEYDVRQLFDLARFLLPWSIMPRRWRSSLFEKNAGDSTKTVCSSMIAAAFTSVQFPILPVIHKTEDGLRLFRRNIRLFTPKDFDYSPYFQIIKYPLLGLNDLSVYRQLPWDQDGVICNDENDCYIPAPIENKSVKIEHVGADNNIETMSKPEEPDKILDQEKAKNTDKQSTSN